MKEEIIFPDEPVDIGTPWKHHYIYPPREWITWNEATFKIIDIEKCNFGFSGFLALNQQT